MKTKAILIVGGGPAGLTAGLELVTGKYPVHIFEKSENLGGIARTELHNGNRFDIGGHRFYTKLPEVQKLWEDMLGERFLKVPRLSRIFYLGQFFEYPINPIQVLIRLGATESLKIFLSYLRARLFPSRDENNFEQWVSNRFGRRLYSMFFKTYTEKVWGIPCNQIKAEWAAQRIMDLSIGSAIRNAILGDKTVKSLIDEFHYPVKGPGMMWEAFSDRIVKLGGSVELNSDVIALHHHGNRVTKLFADMPNGEKEFEAGEIISTMPIDELINKLVPPPPKDVLKAANSLNYRAFILVGLVMQGDLFPDNWIYIHSPDLKVGRIQNFKNWSAEMVAEPALSSIGMEYFCNEGDELWSLADEKLVDLATRELFQLGLSKENPVLDTVVFRQTKAYPIYANDYRESLDSIRAYLEDFQNLQSIGRNGMFRYNNQDHSMLTGMLAAKNVKGESHNLWTVNTERSYYEDFKV